MIEKIAVVGAGTMGAGIAQLCAQNGCAVRVFDVSKPALDSFLSRIGQSLDSAVSRGRLGPDIAARARGLVAVAPSINSLGEPDIVIEAAVEDLDLKKKMFAEIADLHPRAILATNTSSLSVEKIFSASKRPERALGLHFFNPPVAMKLVEIVRAPLTNSETFAAVKQFASERLGRTPIAVKDTPGFIVNRVMRPYYVDAQRIANARMDFAAIDKDCRERGGFPMGPFELMDLIGLDTNLLITRAIYEALGRPERFSPPALQTELVKKGIIGRKSDRGFYEYAGAAECAQNREALALLPAGAAHSEPALRLKTAIAAEASGLVSEGSASAEDVDAAVRLAMNFKEGPFSWSKNAAGRP